MIDIDDSDINSFSSTLDSPLITVFMPMYNSVPYLRQAIDSILSQTCKNFELLIIDDCSTDDSLILARSYHDPRIRVIANKTHVGLGEIRNQGISLAKGTFLALMDSDDISAPSRLQTQITYMNKDPELGAVGTWVKRFYLNSFQLIRVPLKHEDIRCGMLFQMSICHATIMWRRDLLIKYKLQYPLNNTLAEDYEFCIRALDCIKFQTIPKVLYFWRQLPNSASNLDRLTKEREYLPQIYRIQLDKIGVNPSEELIKLHFDISQLLISTDNDWLFRVHNWLMTIWAANNINKLYSPINLSQTLGRIFYTHCTLLAKNKKARAWHNYQHSFWYDKYKPPLISILSFYFHSFISIS